MFTSDEEPEVIAFPGIDLRVPDTEDQWDRVVAPRVQSGHPRDRAGLLHLRALRRNLMDVAFLSQVGRRRTDPAFPPSWPLYPRLAVAERWWATVRDRLRNRPSRWGP